MQYVRTRVIDQPKYNLLTPGNHQARSGPAYQFLHTKPDLTTIEDTCRSIAQSEFVAIDFETKGVDYSLPNFEIVGVGLAWDAGSCYIPWAELGDGERKHLAVTLLEHRGTIYHNYYFDGGVIYSQWGAHSYPGACTYSLSAHLANESPEQRWGLKHLMVELLGWSESNEADLDEWLCSNGYYKGARRVRNDPEFLIEEYRKGILKPEKGEMWRSPVDILGKYCVLDAEATYLLFTEVLRPTLDQFPGLIKQQEEFLHLIRELIEQKCGGLDIDRDLLQARQIEVAQRMSDFVHDITSHPEAASHIHDMEISLLEPLVAKEPARLKKNGEMSKTWENWNTRLIQAREGLLPDYRFNVNSDFHLRELLYKRMGHEVRLTTESGLPGTSLKALQPMGNFGRLLIDYNYLQKELGFLEGYLELTEARPTIHPSFRCPGTVTGRLSSKEPNLQQVPKTKSMMSMFKARPGMVWVDIDFAALESVVAAEFSQDPNMLALYGDGMPENDIHLFVAASVPGEMGKAVLRTGYRPLNPPPGSVSLAKKEAKKWRSIAKTVVYACQFGAGVKKVVETLEADNVFLPFHEVETIHSTYWETFAKLKDFGKSLFYEWRRNGGYILNGMSRPMAVPEDYTKDLLSRFIQSTGHDILIKYVYILTHLLRERGIKYRPVIIDWHDATTIEVVEENLQPTIECMNWAMDELNRQLCGTIRMRGKPTWGTNLADIKEPEE